MIKTCRVYLKGKIDIEVDIPDHLVDEFELYNHIPRYVKKDGRYLLNELYEIIESEVWDNMGNIEFDDLEIE